MKLFIVWNGASGQIRWCMCGTGERAYLVYFDHFYFCFIILIWGSVTTLIWIKKLVLELPDRWLHRELREWSARQCRQSPGWRIWSKCSRSAIIRRWVRYRTVILHPTVIRYILYYAVLTYRSPFILKYRFSRPIAGLLWWLSLFRKYIQ